MNNPGMMSRLLPIIIAMIGLSGCGESSDDGAETPYEAYTKLANAAAVGDFGYMYDVLDSTSRGQLSMMIDVQLQQLDQLPPEERARWEALKGLEGKEAFIKMVELNRELMTSRFRGDFEILDIDTIVVVKVKHAEQQGDIAYFKWEDGRLRFTPPPRPSSEPAAVRIDPPAPPKE